MNDILIKNATILDGTGAKPTMGNIGVHNGIITEMGASTSEKATRVIDATGIYAAPGSIDTTNHSDTHWTIFSMPSQESMLMQGITTIFGGSCGSSLAPFITSDDIQTIQKWADISAININWLSMAEFLEELKRHPMGVNFGTLVGHGTLRRDVMKDSAVSASVAEREKMLFLLTRALDEGAFGLSLGLTFSHGRPADDEELIVLARAVAASHKVVTVHMRDEGKNLLPSVSEVLRIARESGARVHIAHMKGVGRETWEYVPRAIELIRKARSEGLVITADVFPYTKTGSLLYALLPSWVRDGGRKAMLAKIADPNEKRKIIESLELATLHYERIVIASAKKDKHLVGRSLLDIASTWSIQPEEALLRVLAVNDFAVTIFGSTLNDEQLLSLYNEPFVHMSTDGVGYDATALDEKDLAHPRSFGATARFLSTYIRDKQLCTWEEGIRRLTWAPAEVMGIRDRGRLAKNMRADIVLFDPQALADNATYERPFQHPTGIRWVLVNGKVAVADGAYTREKAGMILQAPKTE